MPGKVVERAAGRGPVRDAAASLHHRPAGRRFRGSTNTAERLPAIEGAVPDLSALPSGCRFHPRCPFAVARCRGEEPPLAEVASGPFAALLARAARCRCWRHERAAARSHATSPSTSHSERSLLGNALAAVKAVDGVELRRRRRRDAGAGRRDRLRQVHHRPPRAAPARAERGQRRFRRARHLCARRARRCAACAARCRSSSRTPTPRSTRA